MMSAIGFDYDWDIENTFASEETNQAYPLMQDTEMPQEMFAEQSTEFPTKSEWRMASFQRIVALLIT